METLWPTVSTSNTAVTLVLRCLVMLKELARMTVLDGTSALLLVVGCLMFIEIFIISWLIPTDKIIHVQENKKYFLNINAKHNID